MSDDRTADGRRIDAASWRLPGASRSIAEHGRKKQAEPSDPLELTGRIAPGEPDYLARCFVEELAAIGYDATAILQLFRDPRYVGVHAIYRRRGENAVRRLIGAVLADCGVMRVIVETPLGKRSREFVQVEAPERAREAKR